MNQADCSSSSRRRAELGVHHHFAGSYLAAYASEMAWRENSRPVSNSEEYLMMTGASPRHAPSQVWKDY